MKHVDIDAIEARHLAAMRGKGTPEGAHVDILNDLAYCPGESVAHGRLDSTDVDNNLEDAALCAALEIKDQGENP